MIQHESLCGELPVLVTDEDRVSTTVRLQDAEQPPANEVVVGSCWCCAQGNGFKHVFDQSQASSLVV